MCTRVAACRGIALLDLIASCGLTAILLAIAVPTLQATRERDAVRLAARLLATRLQLVRVEAVRRNRMVAMRFDPEVIGRFVAYVDGDGDGVSQRDIDRGTDTILGEQSRLSDFVAGVGLHVNQSVPAPDGDGVIDANSDPLRIGSSNFMSFSPLGTATSGTIYIGGASGPQMCVRVLGATGRVRVLWFDPASGQWRQD